MPSVKVIAEIGENHIGNIQKAKQMITEAKKAGADYAKFQSYRAENFRPDDPEYDWFKKVSLSDESHWELKEETEKVGLRFLSAPFSVERAQFLVEILGLTEIKVSSGMMHREDLLSYLNGRVDTVFLSTGMATLEEVKAARCQLDRVKNCYLLHCVTQYPCADSDANLLAITALKKEFPNDKIGYSDHTIGITAALGAVALGAEVIEKHFTFDLEAKEGTDHILSADYQTLPEMISQIRRLEKMRGVAAKIPTASEKEITAFLRNRFVKEEAFSERNAF